jgi:hypothetical protein
MDEKTEELRDIFVDATGSDTVTESQEETPGSLTADRDAPERVAEVIETMRERYEFRTDLDTAALREVVERYHEGEADAEVAAALDVSEETVFDARMDLHLVREADREAPFDLGELRSMLVEDADIAEAAEALDAEASVVAHYRNVIEADLEATRANDRFRDEFAELLTDADLASTHARDAREDGLRDATEDIESNVSF